MFTLNKAKQPAASNKVFFQEFFTVVFCGVILFFSSVGHAIGKDSTAARSSVTLHQLLEAASVNHPSLRAAKNVIQAAQKDIESNKRLRWPEVTFVVESDKNKEPTSTPSRSARLQQTLWDFGRISNLVSESEVNADIAHIRQQLQEQELHLQIIAAWQEMLASHRRIAFAQASLETLNEFQDQMRRRVEAMASPSIDLELVESRLLQAQVELNSAQSQLSHSLFVLEQLSGLPLVKQQLPGDVTPLALAQLKPLTNRFNNADWPALARSHAAVRAAELEHQAALRQLDSQTAAQFPQVYLRIEKPIAKTQFNSNTSTNWFVGLNYSTGSGFSGLSQLQSQAFRVQAALEQIDTAQIQIARDMQTDLRDLTSTISRLESLQRSVAGSQKVLDSYKRQFQGGRKSWLDLLNAARELTQNQYLLADAEAISTASAYRLLKRTQHAPLTSVAY